MDLQELVRPAISQSGAAVVGFENGDVRVHQPRQSPVSTLDLLIRGAHRDPEDVVQRRARRNAGPLDRGRAGGGDHGEWPTAECDGGGA